MPRPKARSEYRYLLAQLAEDGLKPQAITNTIAEVAKKKIGLGDPPGLRTVERYYTEHMKKPPEERRAQSQFHWPQTMIINALPWGASRAALDLVRHRVETSRPRPTVAEAAWCWRIRLASPSIPIEHADWWASWYAVWDFSRQVEPNAKPQELNAEVEAVLSFEPWSSPDAEAKYNATRTPDALCTYPASPAPFAATPLLMRRWLMTSGGLHKGAADKLIDLVFRGAGEEAPEEGHTD